MFSVPRAANTSLLITGACFGTSSSANLVRDWRGFWPCIGDTEAIAPSPWYFFKIVAYLLCQLLDRGPSFYDHGGVCPIIVPDFFGVGGRVGPWWHQLGPCLTSIWRSPFRMVRQVEWSRYKFATDATELPQSFYSNHFQEPYVSWKTIMSSMNQDSASREIMSWTAFVMIVDEWCGCLSWNGVNESLSRLG